jgi:hypothetical protein
MMFLFTTSNKIGARAIRWALNEPVSHFAICFDETENGYGIVFHSTMNGVKFDWWHDFYKHNKIVYALKPKQITLQQEEAAYQSIVSKHYGRDYDRLAFLAFSYYALRRKLAGTAIPSGQSFGSSNRYLCTELAHSLKQLCPGYVPNPLAAELISPYSLYLNMQQSTLLERVPWITGRLDV